MTLSRRSLLGGILAAAVAPAIVRSGILMPVRQIIVPEADWLRQQEKILRYAAAYGAGPATLSELIAKTFTEHQARIMVNIQQHNALFRRLA